MVTLRRDIAAVSDNRVFDRKDSDSAVLTDYDLFMEKKKQQKYFCEYKAAKPSQTEQPTEEKEDAFSKIFNRAPEKEDISTHNQNSDNEYKKYLIEQLNRKEPEELLSKESFYSKHSTASLSGATAAVRPTPKKLSKNAKIFVALYVLVVAIVASIILAVNSASEPQRVDASAISGNARGEISPMDVPAESDEETSNRFDRLLDGLSNG